MSQFAQQAEALQTFAAQARSIIGVADFLSNAGNLEGYVDELTKQVATLETQRGAAEASIAESWDSVRAARGAVTASEDRAKAVLKTATSDASDVIAGASAQGAAIIAAAEADCKAMLSSLDDRRLELREVTVQLHNARADLQSTIDKLAAVKQAAAALAG